MRLIDADSLKDFFFSETSGTEETIRDLAEKHNLTYLNDVNEDGVMSFAKDLLEAVQNVIETEPTAYDPGQDCGAVGRTDNIPEGMHKIWKQGCGTAGKVICHHDDV